MADLKDVRESGGRLEEPAREARQRHAAEDLPLYKQATAGDVDGKRPGFTDMVSRAKVGRLERAEGKGANDAMQEYVDLIDRAEGLTPEGVRSFGALGATCTQLRSGKGRAGCPRRFDEAVGWRRLPCAARPHGPPRNSFRELRSLRSTVAASMKTKRAVRAPGRELCAARRLSPRAARSALLNQPWHATYSAGHCWFSGGRHQPRGGFEVADSAVPSARSRVREPARRRCLERSERSERKRVRRRDPGASRQEAAGSRPTPYEPPRGRACRARAAIRTSSTSAAAVPNRLRPASPPPRCPARARPASEASVSV